MPDRPAPGRHRVIDRPPDPSSGLNRRQVLTLGSLAVAAVAAKTTLGSALASAAPAAGAAWPGHKPGKIYLGASGADLDVVAGQGRAHGLRRTYYKWSGGTGETRNITKDHAANRLPWISFKPASTAAGGWAAIASGRYDADIRARARRYAAYSKPVIVTFNHEPHNDNTGTPADFAKAWTRIHDVMANETSLKNVVSVPIIGDWCFNPRNKNGHPEGFITEAVLDRCHFLGVDLYQNHGRRRLRRAAGPDPGLAGCPRALGQDGRPRRDRRHERLRLADRGAVVDGELGLGGRAHQPGRRHLLLQQHERRSEAELGADRVGSKARCVQGVAERRRRPAASDRWLCESRHLMTTNLAEIIPGHAQRTPDRVLVSRRAGAVWEPITALALHEQVTALALGFLAAGVAPGDRVALMAKTRYEWTLVDAALWAVAAVTVPVYETSSAEQLRWILADSGAVGAVVEGRGHAVMLDTRRQ